MVCRIHYSQDTLNVTIFPSMFLNCFIIYVSFCWCFNSICSKVVYYPNNFTYMSQRPGENFLASRDKKKAEYQWGLGFAGILFYFSYGDESSVNFSDVDGKNRVSFTPGTKYWLSFPVGRGPTGSVIQGCPHTYRYSYCVANVFLQISLLL